MIAPGEARKVSATEVKATDIGQPMNIAVVRCRRLLLLKCIYDFRLVSFSYAQLASTQFKRRRSDAYPAEKMGAG
jgi:hypothetical protein